MLCGSCVRQFKPWSVQTAKQWVERETAALEALQRDARAVEAATAASAASRRADLECAATDVTADRAALERRETDLRCRLTPLCSQPSDWQVHELT